MNVLNELLLFCHVYIVAHNVMVSLHDSGFSNCYTCLQEKQDAFYIGDMSEIARKHSIWKRLLPRVQPFYGNYIYLWSAYSTYQSVKSDVQINRQWNNQVTLMTK